MFSVPRILVACLIAAGPVGVTSAVARAHVAPQRVAGAGDEQESRVVTAKYSWSPQASSSGPVEIVVSLPEQRAYVYRGGVEIGESEVSTGMEGKETPTGVFPILEKQVFHRSSKYDDAPMPFMQRLTWYGVALHGGKLPGYAASHGCIRLPLAFARKLFGITSVGTKVVVTDEPADGVSPREALQTASAGRAGTDADAEVADPEPDSR